MIEAKGESAAQLMEHLKKADMAREAERMLADTGWLPELLRLPGDGADGETLVDEAADEPVAGGELPAFLADEAATFEDLGAEDPNGSDASGFAVAAE